MVFPATLSESTPCRRVLIVNPSSNASRGATNSCLNFLSPLFNADLARTRVFAESGGLRSVRESLLQAWETQPVVAAATAARRAEGLRCVRQRSLLFHRSEGIRTATNRVHAKKTTTAFNWARYAFVDEGLVARRCIERKGRRLPYGE